MSQESLITALRLGRDDIYFALNTLLLIESAEFDQEYEKSQVVMKNKGKISC